MAEHELQGVSRAARSAYDAMRRRAEVAERRAEAAERRAVRGQIGRDHRLLAILPAADVEQVVAARCERRPDRDGLDA